MNTSGKLPVFRVCEPIPLSAIPVTEPGSFETTVKDSITRGGRIVSFFGIPGKSGESRLFAVVADDAGGTLSALSCMVGGRFDSLTPSCPQLHLFEREIAEQLGIAVPGHPWLKPVRFPRGDTGSRPAAGETDFFAVKGEDVHEVAVGPVHAGVIEPGHFRFQCNGENVIHLEISLGYQHRGIEAALIHGPHPGTRAIMETVAGDSTVGHTLAYCQLLEALSGCTVTMRAQSLRGIALEIERCANHTGDLGALAGDVGYLPTASYCGRIRGDFLNMSAILCGSRFGRGFVREGGTGFDCDNDRINAITGKLADAEKDLATALDLLFSESTVTSRFEGTGTLSNEDCRALGIVGPAARASNCIRDVRCDFPTGIYTLAQIQMVNAGTGDVFARAFVRRHELQCSIRFIREQLGSMAHGRTEQSTGPLQPDSFVVSMIEGWRGEICHTAITDDEGKFAGYKITDPSFHNWTALALAMRNQQISDFPLCNKSFNLSYCGFDL
jgi:Ni,Fe-hydrogenase III large subunit